MITKYNEFINEGIIDLLSGYSMEEVKEKIKKLTPIDRYEQLKDLYLTYKDIYTQEEIDNFTGLDKIISSNKYDLIKNIYGNRAKIKLDGKWGIIDETGKEITQIKYDWIYYYNSIGTVVVQLNKKYGFVDKSGKEITPIKYDRILNFYDGMTKVILNNKIGIIDEFGNEQWD